MSLRLSKSSSRSWFHLSWLSLVFVQWMEVTRKREEAGLTAHPDRGPGQLATVC